jgi:hypothetical protein
MDTLKIQIGQIHKRTANFMHGLKVHERDLQEGWSAWPKSGEVEHSFRPI